jgi:asparagine synthase (glutamine-hydrolysing)
MSSIVGVHSPEGLLPDDSQLHEALAAMKRRGGDQVRIFRSERCAMAVAPFDPTEDGRHPGFACSTDGCSGVLIDGVLDSVNLRSDGDAFVQSLLADPDKTLGSLDGDFALAAWDEGNQQLLLGTDPLGSRPMCIAADGRRTLFASTPKALKVLGHHAQVDLDAVGLMLQLGIMPYPWSGYRGIERMGPGRYRLVTPASKTETEYWHFHQAAESGRSEAEQIHLIRQELEAAVMACVAGVNDPLFCMSGGIDSTAIAGIGRKLLGKRIRTICLGFEGACGDDRPYAQRASQFVDTDHEEVQVTARMLGESMDDIVDALAIPSVLSFAEYFLTRSAASRAPLILTGETADSQFGGTSLFVFLHSLATYRKIPKLVRRLMAGVSKWIPAKTKVFGKHPGVSLRVLDSADRATAAQRYLSIRQAFSVNEVNRLLATPMADPLLAERYLDAITAPYETAPVDAMVACMLRHEVPNEYLRDEFKLACPTLYRSPYASPRMARLAMSIPTDLKIKGTTQKWALIEAVRDVLPEEAITRKKMGFSLPVAEWLRGPLSDSLRESLSKAVLPDFLDYKIVDGHCQRFLNGDPSVGWQGIWLLWMTSLWANKHLV